MMDSYASDVMKTFDDAKKKMMSRLPVQPSMRSTIAVLIVLIVLTSDTAAAFKMHPHPAAFVARGTRDDSRYDNGMADMDKRNSIMNTLFKMKCKFQASECNPFKKECCNNMKCLNYDRGYCRYPWEPCMCFPAEASDVY